jgi:hypothetical protein
MPLHESVICRSEVCASPCFIYTSSCFHVQSTSGYYIDPTPNLLYQLSIHRLVNSRVISKASKILYPLKRLSKMFLFFRFSRQEYNISSFFHYKHNNSLLFLFTKDILIKVQRDDCLDDMKS